MDNTYLLYLQEIPNTSWVTEVISEKFDDAINMMTTNAVVYGGAVRDCLAGKELVGDLDIMVSSKEYYALTDNFTRSSKWILVKAKQQLQSSSYKNLYESSHLFHKIPYLTSFRALDGQMVQIISPPLMDNTSFQTIIHFTKQVDIVCCGVILTGDNRVFEVVPNAYRDCKKGVLHLNNLLNIINLKQFQSRVGKLVSRGWNNNMNMKQIIKDMERQQRQKLKQKNLVTQLKSRHAV